MCPRGPLCCDNVGTHSSTTLTMPMFTDSAARPIGPTVCVATTVAVLALTIATAQTLVAQSITPRFAWPANSVAEIAGYSYTLTRNALNNDSTGFALTSRLEVRAHPEGLLIISGPSSGGPSTAALAASGLSMDAMNRVVTKMIVSSAGRFIRIDDDGQAARQMDSAMAPMIERMRATSPELADRLIAARSAAASSAGKSQPWLALGGRLFDRSWAPGDSVVETIGAASTTAATALAPTIVTTRHVGAAPCPRDSGATACWTFSTSTAAPVFDVRESLRKRMQALGIDDANLPVMSAPRSTNEVHMLFDAATGRPLEQTAIITSAVTATLDGQSLDSSNRIVVVMRYNWHSM